MGASDSEIDRIRNLLSSLERAHSLLSAGEGSSGDFRENIMQLRVRVEGMDQRITHINNSLDGVNLGVMGEKLRILETQLKLHEDRKWQIQLALVGAILAWITTLAGVVFRISPAVKEPAPVSVSAPAYPAPAPAPAIGAKPTH